LIKPERISAQQVRSAGFLVAKALVLVQFDLGPPSNPTISCIMDLSLMARPIVERAIGAPLVPKPEPKLRGKRKKGIA
jgi:hypothetical protein